MSTAELEELLRASAHPESQMDDATVLLILEVLEARDPAMQPQEVTAAWERFERDVLAASESAQTEDETNIELEHDKLPQSKKRKTLSKILGTAAILVVILFAAGSLIPSAQGTNFWTVILDWTRETFGFAADGEEQDDGEIPEQLKELADDMISYKITGDAMIPHYIPEGYEAVATTVDERDDVIVLVCHLQKGEESIVLQYRVWKDNDPSSEVQKNEEYPEEFSNQSSQIFYIASNEDLYNVKWIKGSVEGSILNVSTREELIKILDSIQGD